MHPTRSRPLTLRAALVAAAGLALPIAITGCKSTSAQQANDQIDASLAAAKRGDYTAAAPTGDSLPQPPATPGPAWAAQGPVLDLTTLIDRAAAGPDPAPGTPIPDTIHATTTTADAADDWKPCDPALMGPMLPDNEPLAVAPPPPPKPLNEQIQDAAINLVSLLNQIPALEPDKTWRAYLALAALDIVRPGSMPKVISPDGKGAAVLTPEETATAEAVRQFLGALAAIPSTATPQARSAKIAELADNITAAAPMRMGAVELCARVMGYGQYLPLGTSKFLQGRPQRAIVYVEVVSFGHRPVAADQSGGGDRWAVDLAQTLQLYHDADGTLAWSRPEEELMESSRNKRRDFYLVTDITLPPTLTIGAYRLKVIMRDKVSGQVDERVIPFEVVADPGLAFQPDSGK